MSYLVDCWVVVDTNICRIKVLKKMRSEYVLTNKYYLSLKDQLQHTLKHVHGIIW